MSKEFTPLKLLKELPEDYKFVYRIKACECKVDFDTNTMVDKILSTRTKKVDEEVIRQLRDIGKAKGINELILINESKVLKMIKSLKAFEIIKELLYLKVIQLLPNDSDTRLFVECGNFKASILIPPPYIELLKEELL